MNLVTIMCITIIIVCTPLSLCLLKPWFWLNSKRKLPAIKRVIKPNKTEQAIRRGIPNKVAFQETPETLQAVKLKTIPQQKDD